ncbi:class I SAM-dependent methyltransferase [Lysobacter olei]
MVPPRECQKAIGGGGDYLAIGRELRDCLIQHAGLTESSKVLEIGSGYGRVAVALTDVLRAGTYDGVEILEDGVRWSRERITPRFPNFTFHHADVANAYIRENGREADGYRLPFADGTFDLVYLTSVFTHMRPAVIRHYLTEIARVLKQGGRLLATYYLVDDFTRTRMATTAQAFPYELDGFYTGNLETPEHAIAIEVSDAMQWLAESGLEASTPLFGGWSGRTPHTTWQDAIVARKG